LSAMSSLHSEFYEVRAKEFFEPIGRYVFYFGMLEQDIDKGLSALLKIPYFNLGQTTFAQINSLLTLCKLVEAVSRSATTDQIKLDQIAALVTRIRSQNTFRNNLVHGAWTAYFEHPDGARGWQKMSISSRMNARGWNVTVPEIAEGCAELIRLSGELPTLIAEICTDRDTGRFPPPDIIPGLIPPRKRK
jgi:hypothetical protein